LAWADDARRIRVSVAFRHGKIATIKPSRPAPMSSKEKSYTLYNSLPTLPDDKIYYSNYVYPVYNAYRKFSLGGSGI
jgi:hypothetical protein